MSALRSAFELDAMMVDYDLYLNSSDDDLLGELSQDFIEASQFFRRLPLYYQIGSGFENRPGPSNEGLPFVENAQPDNLEDAVILEERARRHNAKFQAEEIIYRARIDTERLPARFQQENALSTTVDSVRQLFALLIQRTTTHLRATDLIRFCIQAEGLDKPISTCLMLVSEMTVEKVVSTVMKVLQSKDTIQLDAGFTVDVITIQRPVGAGRTKILNVAESRLTKHSVFVIPSDEEGLCCAKSIVYAIAYLKKDKTALEALKRKDRPALIKRARQLHEAANIPLGPCTFKEVALFEKYLNVQIAVFSTDHLNRVAYKGVDRADRINLWLHEGHYDVIKNVKGFLGCKNYCFRCDKPYEHKEYHCCADACPICNRQGCMPGSTVRCSDCDRLCKSQDCFTAHKALSGQEQYSLCDRVYQCRKCCRVIHRRFEEREKHCCGTTRCPSCDLFVVASEHRCHLKSKKATKPSDRLIFFDFETDQSSGEHWVNFAVAQYTDGTEMVFSGYDACHKFCVWLFSQQHKGFTAIAHNMKGFDGQFIMSWLLKQGTAPEVIPNGSMLMCIHHKSAGIRIIDSLNFLPMPLAKLPACFGLSELKKGYFPHFFNSRENQDYVGPLPEARYYSPDTMGTSARNAFYTWYEKHQGEEFNFQAEMAAYCKSDVDILRRCCLEFRSQFLSVANVDPFQYVTIASACMATYRSGHIQPDTIAMVPVHGYVNRTNYSPDSIRWLDFLASKENLQIQHALNNTGEHKIGGVSIDGFCPENNTVYQYQGCFFHGCTRCYDGDALHPLKGVTMATLNQKTEDTTTMLRSLGYTVIEMWEHEFQVLKRDDPNLKTFLEKHLLQDRLNPRDAFFGGRTNAVKLFHEGDAKYVDFTSLYPWVNKYCIYPVGHPQIITEGLKDVEEYFGIIQCGVIPPRGLYLPVLPYRCRNKLMFPLCRVCAESLQQSPCTHTDEERALTGTWVSEELKLAKKMGYRVTHMYEVYHFKDTSASLFKSYIDLFLKIKQESSGWPADCVTPEQKTKYICQYEVREGIRLEASNICKNPGRRQVAKLALNSFWGRWGMNTNKTQLSYIQDLADYNKIMADPTKKIKDMYLPSPEIAAIQWEAAKDFVVQDASTNIFLAAFTTAWARLKLYEEMAKLGENVLYHDTDSIVYACTGFNDPPLGNFLGDFTDELDGDIITTFVSGGPKNYAYQTAAGKTCCKVRGFTLNFRNSQLLNFDTVKSLVCEMDGRSVPLYNPSKICREGQKRRVVNKEETKLYRVVYDKRVIQEDLTTLPYGY